MLDAQTTEKIKALVYQRPRNINELALILNKNWRTVNRYIEEIMLRSGSIKTLTFREGTRGALKIVYWNNTEKIYSSDVQEQLFKQIEAGIEKSDFSPFEIYQYIDADQRQAYYEKITNEKDYSYRIETLAPHFVSTEKEICIFAGNLAFINLVYKKRTLLEYMKEVVKKKILIKVITNINLVDMDNIEAILSLNAGLKEPLVELRHAITPLRAYIFDNRILKMGEIAKSQGKKGQMQEVVAIYYEVRDQEWIDWMQKVFWKKFQNAIPSNLRLESVKSIRKVK